MAVAITQTANPAGVSSSSNVATYSGVAIGAAASNRIVVVLVGSELASASINSVTIGGSAMSAGTQGNQGAVYARAFYLLYPTGTTADIVVTYGANASNTQNHIAVYTVIDGAYSSTGADQSTDMDATDPLTTGSTTIGTGGGMIAVAARSGGTGGQDTWSNLGEDLDVDGGAFGFTTAFSTTAGTATRTCTAVTTGEDGALSWLIFTDNAPPSVVLNTPTDGSATTDTTPTFDFTGTDPNTDSIRYQLQIDTVDTFDSQAGSPATFGTTAKQSSAEDLVVSAHAYAWKYTAPETGTITKLSLYGKLASGTGTAKMALYSVVGGTITNRLAISSAVSMDTTEQTWDFPLSYAITAGTEYAIAIGEGSGSITINSWMVTGAGVNLNYDTGTTLDATWSQTGSWDAKHAASATYTPSVPLIDVVSGTDSGFANPDTGGDTDPFNSGENIQFTVQAGDALASGEYFWRVRGIDPSGSNTYGAWSDPQTFYITVAASTLTDNFNDNSIDTAKWEVQDDWGTLSETNSQIEVTIDATEYTETNLTAYTYLDLTGGSVSTKVVSVDGSLAYNSVEIRPIHLGFDGGVWWEILGDGDVVQARDDFDGGTPYYSVAYNSSTHKYFRIRESGGTTYWDYSADGSSWNNAHSKTSDVDMSILQFYFSVNADTEAAGEVIVFDNVNSVDGEAGGTAVKDIIGMGILPFAR